MPFPDEGVHRFTSSDSDALEHASFLHWDEAFLVVWCWACPSAVDHSLSEPESLMVLTGWNALLPHACSLFTYILFIVMHFSFYTVPPGGNVSIFSGRSVASET